MPRASVIIGLGGGGKVILMKLRRLIVEEYGSLEAMPHVRFLHVDTFDSPNLEPGQGFQDKVLGVNILFSSGNERVELSRGLAGGNKEQLVEDNRVQAWYPDDLPVTADFTKGAGGVRPFGKLAFHYNVNLFEETLNKVANTACQAGKGGVDALVVASLFGGTGSGVYLDVCYNVRKVLKNMGVAPRILGYFVIGARKTDPNMQSSCYAALQELEYFTTMGILNTLKNQSRESQSTGHGEGAVAEEHTPFIADYPIAGVTGITSGMPPVDVCYLFGATNAEQIILDRDPLEETVAKRVFFELMEGIGTPLEAKRADIMNQPSYYAGDRLQGRTKTFFSTGISVIEFPAPQIQNALASGLAAYCCHYALFRNALGLSDLKAEVNAFMENLGLKERQIRDQFEKQDSGTVTSSISNDKAEWRRRLKSKIEARPFDKASVEQEILRVKQEAQARIKAAQDPQQSGTYVQTIHNNAERVWKEKFPTIGERIGEMVGDKSIGPKHTEGFIADLRARLKSDKAMYDNLQASYDDRMRREASGKVDWRIGRFLDDLHPKYHWELGKHSQWLCERELALFLQMGAEKATFKSAGDLIHRVDQELVGLQTAVNTYVNKLNAWGQEFIGNMLDVFRNLCIQPEKDPVNQGLKDIMEKILRDFPQDEAKWEDITQRLYDRFVTPLFEKYKIPNPIGNIIAVAEDILKAASRGTMGHSLFQKVTGKDDSFKTAVFDACRKKLEGIRGVSICDLLWNLDPTVRNQLLNEKKNKAAWFLQVSTHDGTINHVPALCEKKWVGAWKGVDRTGHPIWNDLPEYDPLDRMPSLPEPYRMVFVSEIGVFSLRNIGFIEGYREAHDKMKESGGAQDGMVRTRTQNTFKTIAFPDILPPSPLLKDIHMRAERAGLLGKVLSLLKEEVDPQDHYTKVYMYYSDEVTRTQKNQRLCSTWVEVTRALRDAQEAKDIARKRSDVTPMERLENEIHRHGTSASTKEAREALWRKTADYLEIRLKEMGQKEHPFYQSDLAVIEEFRKQYALHPPLG